MAGPLTGSAGWSGLFPLQLGGPPLISTWTRPLAVKAGPEGAEPLPLVAHIYENDGVTSKGTLAVLGRPPIKATLANGGFDQVTLEVATRLTVAVYGQTTYGQTTYGGRVLQGNVLRLTEDGSPWNGFIWGGVVESMPDTRSATGTKHGLVASPFGWELTRVACQLLYTLPVDVAQIVRDAVALTQHCHCDQVSVPPATGIFAAIGGAVDFRGQKLNMVLDTCRSIAGPGWFWFCDEAGRTWFQFQGAVAAYTLKGGQDYEERVSNGGDIQARINQVPAVGGVPAGGSANVQAVANGISQAVIGVRTLDPPVQAPGVTDLATLTAMARGILGTLDQVWTRIQLKALPTFAQRVHGSQPGGAMVRYWEPIANPVPESEAGSGYAGPFIGQVVTHDGLYQAIEAGNIPVTSQTDVQAMLQNWANRGIVNAFQVTPAALNLAQTLIGSFQSGGGAPIAGSTAMGALWALNQQLFRVVDPNGVTRAEVGNLAANGISPAQWGFRASAADGTPIFDSLGLIAVATALATDIVGPTGTQSGLGFGTFAAWPGSGTSFTISRPTSVLVFVSGTGIVIPNPTNEYALWAARVTGPAGFSQEVNGGVLNYIVEVTGADARVVVLPTAGTYTITQGFHLNTDANLTIASFTTSTAVVVQLGG